RVVLHSLGLVLARAPGQLRLGLVEGKLADVADDVAGQENVMVGEGVAHPAVEAHAGGRLAADTAEAGHVLWVGRRAGRLPENVCGMVQAISPLFARDGIPSVSPAPSRRLLSGPAAPLAIGVTGRRAPLVCRACASAPGCAPHSPAARRHKP